MKKKDMPAKKRSKRSSKKRSRRSSRKYGMTVTERKIRDRLRQEKQLKQDEEITQSRPVSSYDTELKNVLSAVESKIKGLGIQLNFQEHFFVQAYLILMFVFPLLKLIEKGTKIENIKKLTNIDKLFNITDTIDGKVDSLNELITQLEQKIVPVFDPDLHGPIYARYLKDNQDVVELNPVQLLKLEIDTSFERLREKFPDVTDEVETMFKNDIGYEANQTLQEFKDKLESTMQDMENKIKEPRDAHVQAIIDELNTLSESAKLL